MAAAGSSTMSTQDFPDFVLVADLGITRPPKGPAAVRTPEERAPARVAVCRCHKRHRLSEFTALKKP